jgi:hypothetical protein
MFGPRQSYEKAGDAPNTDQPTYDSDHESSPRLEGDTSDDVGRDELE